MVSLRLPIAGVAGATLLAWRAFETAPEYSKVRADMMGWVLLGALLLVVGFFWELVRWYQRMDRRHAPHKPVEKPE